MRIVNPKFGNVGQQLFSSNNFACPYDGNQVEGQQLSTFIKFRVFYFRQMKFFVDFLLPKKNENQLISLQKVNFIRDLNLRRARILESQRELQWR